MAGFSFYSNRDSNSRDTEGLITSTHQGLDRCASLLKALLSPQKTQDHQKGNDKTNHLITSKQLPLLVRLASSKGSDKSGQGHEVCITRSAHALSENVRYCSANKKGPHKHCKTVNTANTVKNRKQAGLLLSTRPATTAIAKRRRKLSRPLPIAMSTPLTNTSIEDKVTIGRTQSAHSGSSKMTATQANHQITAGTTGGGTAIAVPVGPSEEGQSWPQMMWLPPYYQIIDTRAQSNDSQNLKIQQLEAELNEMKKQWKSSQKALEQAQQQVKKLQEEKNEIAQQYAAKIDVLQELQQEEKETLTIKLLQLEKGLKDIEKQWKEKYHEEIELEQQELNEENQMLKLSVAEKETELLQSQDTLLETRQCLAHLLLDLKPSGDKDWQLIPQKDISKIQTIVNTGHCTVEGETKKYVNLSTPAQSSTTSDEEIETTLQSCGGCTTSTEIGFRRDLAALDADIARLQLQFNVAQDLYH